VSKLYGLLGEKLGHSLSPQIHSAMFKELNIDGYYHLFQVKKEELEKGFSGFKALGVKGINVTIPYKVDVMKYLDHISEEAEEIGAVNTIHFKDDIAVGYNTDYYGFGMMLKKYDVNVKNKNAVILGTGGASKAVVQYLIDNNVGDIVFVTRNVSKAKEKYKDIKKITYNEINNLNNCDIVINCTPVGMHPNVDNSPISRENISKFHTAVDLIYNPRETLFLKYAKEQGAKAINGLYMLVGQAVKAEEIWNDVNIDERIVERIYEEIYNY
jgi:shikimate dehydrogenase